MSLLRACPIAHPPPRSPPPPPPLQFPRFPTLYPCCSGAELREPCLPRPSPKCNANIGLVDTNAGPVTKSIPRPGALALRDVVTRPGTKAQPADIKPPPQRRDAEAPRQAPPEACFRGIPAGRCGIRSGFQSSQAVSSTTSRGG